MTTEPWTEERFNQLANLVDSNARVIQALAQVSAEAREERDQIFQTIAEQNNEIRDIKIEIREMQVEIRQMQIEIRGMQVENRRILDILLNQRRDDDSGNSHTNEG